MQSTSRCGFVTVLGKPNVGKSTLTNALVGEKVSIVSRKVQTTRTKILGIYVDDNTQVILVDTPGLFRPSKALEKRIVDHARSAIPEGDLGLWVCDATQPFEEGWPSRITQPFVVINKIDLVSPSHLQKFTSYIKVPTFFISAIQGTGLKELKEAISKALPPSPFLYPVEDMTNVPLRTYAAEITRETVFELLDHELPYEIYVETEQFETLADGSTKISQVIGVARQSQKMIVLGKGGSMIKDIGTRSRLKLEKQLESRVHLFLFVKVHTKWMDNEFILKDLYPL